MGYRQDRYDDVEEDSPLIEFGDAKEEQADGELAEEKRYDDLVPIQPVPFEEQNIMSRF